MTTPSGLTLAEILLRLGVAIVCGAVIGVNRYIHRKPAGLETFSIVALASATIMIVMQSWGGTVDVSAVSRTVQGIVTGIGFLGAGLILHRDSVRKIKGLTTAAAVWLAAVLGMACGLGYLLLAAVVLAATLLILVVGHPIERAFRARFGRRPVPRTPAPGAPLNRSSSDTRPPSP
jgi:putative Mg2+ transporter-C (MgtC) family protein